MKIIKKNQEKRKEAYKFLREKIINERGNKCEVCQNTPKKLDLHHTEYRNERKFILLVCRGCHMKIHKGIIKLNSLEGGILDND